ncbi:diadenylate cyclase [Pseudomonadota bacterium]
MNPELVIQLIIDKLKKGVPNGFSGLGIIFIDDNSDELPISPLLEGKQNFSKIRDEKSIVEFLIKISSYKDERHDGFHIISKTKGLLDISQYFSPPIPKLFENTIYNVGARFRTAQFGSICEKVSLIVIIGQSGDISVAKNGAVAVIKK